MPWVSLLSEARRCACRPGWPLASSWPPQPCSPARLEGPARLRLRGGLRRRLLFFPEGGSQRSPPRRASQVLGRTRERPREVASVSRSPGSSGAREPPSGAPSEQPQKLAGSCAWRDAKGGEEEEAAAQACQRHPRRARKRRREGEACFACGARHAAHLTRSSARA